MIISGKKFGFDRHYGNFLKFLSKKSQIEILDFKVFDKLKWQKKYSCQQKFLDTSIKGFLSCPFEAPSKRKNDTSGTVMPSQYHTPRKRLFCFVHFHHVLVARVPQMIYHLKALIQGFQNLYRNWAWHHPGGATTQLTEKAPPSLKLIYRLLGSRNSNFHSKFQQLLLRAFQKGIIAFPRSTGCKMAGRQSLECETNLYFLAIYVVKQTFFGCAFHT